MSDPFAGGKTRGGADLAWWNPAKPGYRLVAIVDGVFSGKKVEFAKLYDGVIFRTADHKPLQAVDVIAMSTMSAKVRARDAGAIAIVTAIGTKEGKKPGLSFVEFETRIYEKGGEEYHRALALLDRARIRLAEETASAPLDTDDDDLPF